MKFGDQLIEIADQQCLPSSASTLAGEDGGPSEPQLKQLFAAILEAENLAAWSGRLVWPTGLADWSGRLVWPIGLAT
ncbi:hypothetical protein [Pseudophaeobacter arcticus]|uniref:hypothetical protein n=1 Tax=Pseudophaeobacter arcticus TaxID=385492 RepID=UPI0039E3496F